ncbi:MULTISPECIES: Fe-S cluster assembly sulfur transfer protein SufU [unclassified Micromonospora]|uniref:Fe-S cluster assembly sulfur transfer protein SufU n=1 Tax=unclassified Micromonospora TaxID=2617518 RepID=UPI00234B2123|nr:SUF system NifU family Fe-S cluster assembly protein [Micromonospora sp. LH3U1]WCN79826.1 SUF system NifU family Fe-S cluster assembly protein [Micromonospora sp. LH3U1]WTD62228.1 SUF system NifU family Fe-S cluster assembly protein [Micromonospora sp. NBC_01638]
MQLDQLYQEIILDHYKRPHGRGLRDADDAGDRVAEAHHVNPTCGDEVTVRVATDGAVLHDISYDGMGCSISQASASVLHELLRGRGAGEAFEVHEAFVELMSGRGQVTPDEDVLGDGVAFAGVARYPARVKCALLPWMAFKDAAARAGVGVSPEVKA